MTKENELAHHSNKACESLSQEEIFTGEPDKAQIARIARALAGENVPQQIRDNIGLFLRLVRVVVQERNPQIRKTFDRLLLDEIRLNNATLADDKLEEIFKDSISVIDALPIQEATLLVRAFATFFHCANICEEHYRVSSLKQRESQVPPDTEADPANELTVAFRELAVQCGKDEALRLLNRLEFHPVFTAHPTEARRKTVEAAIRRISALLDERDRLGGIDLLENERRLLQEIELLFRTSPIAVKKPTPVEEADTILEIFDATLFDTIPEVYRRFDDWMLGDRAGCVAPVCPAFFHPGSWIGSDRDGNPNVSAKVSRDVSEKFRKHMLEALAKRTYRIAKSFTLDNNSTQPSKELLNLWNHQCELSEALTAQAQIRSSYELHRSVMLVIAKRLEMTSERRADVMYSSCDAYIADLKIVQDSLVKAGAVRSAYGELQKLIWQAQTFGFYMVEMEFRQHSLVHARALDDIEKHGRWGERGQLQAMTKEVLDTFRAIAWIQRRNGKKAAQRYIISFTKSARDVENVYKLARLAFAHPEDVPTLDVIPLFEQLEDLTTATDTLNEMLLLPDVQKRLAQNGRRMEIMLGYSDSSKDAGPTTATLALHKAQEEIAEWAAKHKIDLTLFHGRGGAVGRGGGPANRAVLAQPQGSVNCRFKLTEQGEIIFARYGNTTLARRHVESVAAATLLQSAPSFEWVNTHSTKQYWPMAEKLSAAAYERFRDLLTCNGFAEWFSTVTPLVEIGLMPIGSRPAKRGLGASSLDDLRTIPWVFSWSQARINLAAWYGLGSACEAFGDVDTLRRAYAEWPLFSTFIDNIEMSLAKTDDRLARMYLDLGKRDDLTQKVLKEMYLTKSWVLKIVGDMWPLEHRQILGPVIRMRLPFVNVLSATQVRALRALRLKSECSTEDAQKYIYLILCTVSGVAAGLQNTG